MSLLIKVYFSILSSPCAINRTLVLSNFYFLKETHLLKMNNSEMEVICNFIVSFTILNLCPKFLRRNSFALPEKFIKMTFICKTKLKSNFGKTHVTISQATFNHF